ncbi:glycine-rich domain-containing protein [Amycolatopsis halotolerans]|uniref:Glycine-rich domain-containing protein n=1 Tax=Amycolatopsis halotolerans TaxID=330083 RepID=A0ABV7Q970_9PSEU
MTVAVGELTGKGLVTEALFARLVARIAKENTWPCEYAARVMDQALAFLAACARTSRPLAPSEIVDIGWHAFVLYTREYADFCERISGGFIHHVPDDEAEGGDAALAEKADRTTSAIQAAGFAVDPELWFTSAAKCAKCSQCKNGCTDDPPPSASC